MKRILYILGLFMALSTASYAQDEEGNGKQIQQRMNEYVQKRLGLSKAEAEKFSPVFQDYFNELRKTNTEFKGDRLVLQKKIVDVRLKYRNQFKGIVGEKKSNEVFNYERDFIEEVKALRNDRLQNKNEGGNNKRSKGLLQ
jgi:hypothetical protein